MVTTWFCNGEVGWEKSFFVLRISNFRDAFFTIFFSSTCCYFLVLITVTWFLLNYKKFYSIYCTFKKTSKRRMNIFTKSKCLLLSTRNVPVHFRYFSKTLTPTNKYNYKPTTNHVKHSHLRPFSVKYSTRNDKLIDHLVGKFLQNLIYSFTFS